MTVLVLVTAAGSAADAQVADDPYAAFGGLNAHARAGGVQVSYDVEGVLPLPPPLFAVTVPTSRATTTTGPTSVAFGSLAYPGDLIGNLPVLAEQSSPGSGAFVPPYPLAVLADHPSGPAAAQQDIGTASAQVAADARGARSTTTMTSSDVPGVVRVGAVTTSTRTGLEDGRLVARARSEVSELELLFGALELRDVVVDVVASTDGTTGTTEGVVTVGAISLAGTPIEVGPDGVVVGDLPPALVPVLGTSADVDELLAAAGVRLSVGALEETTDGSDARVDGTALTVELELDGREGALAPLLAALPADDLPGEALPGVPVNTSPQALVNLLKETHVVRVELAPVTARVDASTRYVGAGRAAPPPSSSSVATVPVPAAGFELADPFTTPLPEQVAPVATNGGVVPGRAVEALIGLLLVASLPVWWRGADRLVGLCLASGDPVCTAGRGPGPTGRREGGAA